MTLYEKIARAYLSCTRAPLTTRAYKRRVHKDCDRARDHYLHDPNYDAYQDDDPQIHFDDAICGFRKISRLYALNIFRLVKEYDRRAPILKLRVV